MSNTIKISAEHEYEVLFSDLNSANLEPVLMGATKVAIIVPEQLLSMAKSLQERVAKEPGIQEIVIIEVGEGENQKSLETVNRCWSRLAAANFKRTDSVIGIGGGATTDLAGFVAATWLRGIKWGAIPTSLAGMVDAAIGGKTGINTEAGKNLVGAFHSPRLVVIDFKFLRTLPKEEMRAGMAEVIKTGFISDQEILRIIESEEDVLDVANPKLAELIKRSVAVKAEVVSQDLKESYLRESLNYGHTLAHAIERHQNYSWRHGDAVAVGLAYVANLAYLTGFASEELRDRHIKILEKMGLPTRYPAEAWPNLLEGMQNDKKARASGLRFVAVNGNYEVIRLEGLSDDALHQAYERISS